MQQKMWQTPLVFIPKYLSSIFIDALQKYQQLIQQTLKDPIFDPHISVFRQGNQSTSTKKISSLKYTENENQSTDYYVLRIAKSNGFYFILAIQCSKVDKIEYYTIMIVSLKDKLVQLPIQVGSNLIITVKQPFLQSDVQRVKMSLVVIQNIKVKNIKREMDFSESLKVTGNELFNYGEYQRAFQYYEYALTCINYLDHKKLRAVLYANSSACLYEMRLYDQASRYASIAIKLDPAYPKGYFRKINSLLEKKQFAQIPTLLHGYSQRVDNQKFETLNNKYLNYIANSLGIFNWRQTLVQPLGQNNLGNYISNKIQKRFFNGRQYYFAKQDISTFDVVMVAKPLFYAKIKKEMDMMGIFQLITKIGFLEKGYLDRLLGLHSFHDFTVSPFDDYQLKPKKNMIISHQISQYDSKNPKGVGIWPELFQYQHSCNSNCSYTFIKNSLVVSAKQPIAKNTALTVDYVAYEHCQDRKAALKRQFNISCLCQICEWSWWPSNVEEYLEIIEIAQNLQNKKIEQNLIWEMLRWKQVPNHYSHKMLIKDGIDQLLKLQIFTTDWVDALRLIQFIRSRKFSDKNYQVQKFLEIKLALLLNITEKQSLLIAKYVL